MFQDMFLCPSKHVDKKRRRQQSSFLELFTNGIQGVFSMKKIKEPRMTNDSSIIWYVSTYLVLICIHIILQSNQVFQCFTWLIFGVLHRHVSLTVNIWHLHIFE